MKIVHRVAFSATSDQRRALEGAGVKLPSGIPMPGGSDPFVAFDIAEDQANWPQIRELLRGWNISEGFVRTDFSKSEIGAATWLELGAWHHGYPQPDEDIFGYRQATYDLTDWCEQCGSGMKQKAPFQMKGEPKWGRNGMLQLVWVYDEIFVTPQVWSNVFRPHGIGSRPVLNTKGVELETVVQLVVEEEVGIETAGLPVERCPRCGRTKYLPVTRGPFPALARVPSMAMVKTAEYFGSGGQANKRVLASQAVARALAAAKVRGASLTPVAEQTRPLKAIG